MRKDLERAAEVGRMAKCTRESHEEAKKDAIAWSHMDYVGIQEVDQEYSLELRNCKCGSTLARRIPVHISKCANLSR